MKQFITVIITMLTGMVSCAQSAQYITQDNDEFAKTIADGQTQLVDVRTAEEFATGHIPKAINMDIKEADFEAKSSSLDRSRPVAVYCHSGVRSHKAAKKLAADGFTVYNLGGGILRWNGDLE